MTTPSTSPAEALDWFRLTLVPGVSGEAQRALLRAFGSPAATLAASSPEIAHATNARVASAFARGAEAAWVERALRWLEEPGHHLVTLCDPAFPKELLQIADPPVALYAQGRLELLNAPALAIVGSRNATQQGVRDAEAFARDLSDAGLTIVSGLALGIDAAAHRGGLAGRSSSIAVMGTGADRIYPARNAALARTLAAQGVVITELALGTVPVRDNFPRRNRLISGLARGTLVVEAALASGSLITARCALEQNREVFAIPGSIHSPVAKGAHELIRQGAKLVECADDVLSELRIESSRSGAVAAAMPQGTGDPLLAAIGSGIALVDELAGRIRASAAHVAARLTELEIEGRVALLSGGRVQCLHGPDADPL